MKTEISCARCKARIPIEDSYQNAGRKGFICEECNAYAHKSDWLIGCGIVIVLFFIFLIGG